MLFALSLEGACRLEDWIEYRTPLFARERDQADLLIRDEEGMHGRPGGRFQKWSLNSFGMRGPEVSAVKPLEVPRASLPAGASETFGLYETPGRDCPRQFEDSLNARLLESRSSECRARRAEVLDAAMPWNVTAYNRSGSPTARARSRTRYRVALSDSSRLPGGPRAKACAPRQFGLRGQASSMDLHTVPACVGSAYAVKSSCSYQHRCRTGSGAAKLMLTSGDTGQRGDSTRCLQSDLRYTRRNFVRRWERFVRSAPFRF